MAKRNKKNKKNKNNGPSMKKLIAAAEDLNESLGLDPPMDTDQDQEDLAVAIKENADQIVPEDDLKPTTWETLKAMGIEVSKDEKKEKKEKGKGRKKKAKEEKEPEKKTKKKAKKETKKKKEPAAKKKAPPTRDFSTSNKAQIYRAWKKGTKDPDKLLKVVKKGAVKDTTVRKWVRRWEKGEGLPAIANKN